MNTKLFISLAILLSIAFSLNADTKPTKSTLKEATVFFNGAELTHNASSALTKGDNEIKIEGLSPNIDRNSLKIKASNGVLISAYEFSVDYLSDGKSKDLGSKRYQDSIQYYNDKLQTVNTEYTINTELSDILKKSTDKNVSGSEKGLPIDELVKTMDYYKTKKAELEKVLVLNKKQQVDYQQAINRLTSQMNQESIKNNKTSGVLKLVLTAPMATTSQFTISYFTTAASWAPYYDINIASIDKPIKLDSKAKVRQTTGLDWNKVKLSLSTATPSNGKVAPLFSTWFLQQMNIGSSSARNMLSGKVAGLAMQNSYSYDKKRDSNSELSEIVVRGSGSAKNVNAQPLYIVDGEPIDAEDFADIDPNMVKSIEVLKDASTTAIYGSRASGGVILVSLRSSMDDYVTTSDNELNMTYDIDLPFTVPGNGKEQSLDLQSKEVLAEYKYYSAPKLDTETYLLAEIADWEKLNLLTGKANVTYDGTYVGESMINANSTQANLTLTLGADKRIAVKREKMKDYSSTKFLGNDVKQVFTYKMTVKNNQNKAVKMVLKDQYPLSTQKNIEVELLTKDTTTPTVNKEDMGVITWEETLAPGETRVYQISYSVKYPKSASLNL